MAEAATKPPSSLSQPSRKGKRAWRKNVDLSEVENGLDVVREEIIQGGVIAERPSEELFLTDVAGDTNIAKQQRSKKLLKADEIITRRSAVPGLDRRKRKAISEDADFAALDTQGKKARNGTYVSFRELQRLRRVADGDDFAQRHQIESVTHDPWATSQHIAPAPQHSSNGNVSEASFLEPLKPTRAPDTLRRAPRPKTISGRPVAHVRKPDAGKSYNPHVRDWTALLEREGAAAVSAERARLASEAADAEKEARALAEAAKVEAAELDALGTDYESGWESEWDGIQSETEQNHGNGHVAKPQRRKTQAERNKILARKEREAREVSERKDKARKEQERKIKQIAREVSARESERHAAAMAARLPKFMSSEEEDSDENEGGEIRVRQMASGKPQIPNAPLEITLPEDLEDSLRRLKPEGDLLSDRYRNLLINGKLEVRRKIAEKKKRKTFRTEKWSYKDWKLR